MTNQPPSFDLTPVGFHDVIDAQDQGGLITELDQALAKIVAAVKHTGKAGSVTLELTVHPDGYGRLQITDKVKTKEPVAAKVATFYFITPDGEITLDNPHGIQQQMPTTETIRVGNPADGAKVLTIVRPDGQPGQVDTATGEVHTTSQEAQQ